MNVIKYWSPKSQVWTWPHMRRTRELLQFGNNAWHSCVLLTVGWMSYRCWSIRSSMVSHGLLLVGTTGSFQLPSISTQFPRHSWVCGTTELLSYLMQYWGVFIMLLSCFLPDIVCLVWVELRWSSSWLSDNIDNKIGHFTWCGIADLPYYFEWQMFCHTSDLSVTEHLNYVPLTLSDDFQY